eukprot:m.67288 g.67288  ORF g.67288 m.67288 type:complete len:100 (+) comp9858_c0_seq1:2096-2395(+)
MSCSEPLFIGQNFGAFTVESFPDIAGCGSTRPPSLSLPPVPSPTIRDGPCGCGASTLNNIVIPELIEVLVITIVAFSVPCRPTKSRQEVLVNSPLSFNG